MSKFLTLLKFQLCLLLFKQGKPTTCIIEFHKPHLYPALHHFQNYTVIYDNYINMFFVCLEQTEHCLPS